MSAALGAIVRAGLTAPRKTLPPVLFYDARGSELFERITELPEYYPTRTERGILEVDAPALASWATAGLEGPLAVLELGAGSATKTGLLLRALVQTHDRVTYFPADVSASALAAASVGLLHALPTLTVRPIEATHEEALEKLRRWEGALVVLFLGSSIGNLDDAGAAALLGRVRDAIGHRGSAVLGADRAKATEVLLPAYDDAAGVTAEFNRNVLRRINRELDADFDLDAFAHVAVWNEAAGAVEMHLESLREQEVSLRAIDTRVFFAAGERLHTESSHKYTDERLARLFSAARMISVGRAADPRRWFSLDVLRADLPR